MSAPKRLYLTALDPESLLPGEALTQELWNVLTAGRESRAALPSIVHLGHAAHEWADTERGTFTALWTRTADPETRAELVRRAALGCAPLALRSGAWLQWLSAPGIADAAEVLASLALYAGDVGVGQPRNSRGHAYTELLWRLQVADGVLPVSRLPLAPQIADGAFVLPSVLLAMSRLPEVFRPEILGADLCLRLVGLLPALELVRLAHPAGPNWELMNPGALPGQGDRVAAARASAIVTDLPAEHLERARQGFVWALDGLRAWSRDLLGELEQSCDPSFAMAELLRARAREGAVYHHDVELAGLPLSKWLANSRSDPYPMMAVLAASKLVNPGRAAESPLTNGLVSEMGRMFRVFTPADLRTITRWIDSLPAPHGGGAPRPPVSERTAAHTGPCVPSVLDVPAPPGRTPRDLRDAYHLLQTRTDTPALRRFALEYVHGWLDRSRFQMDRPEMALPAEWSPQGLRPWLLEQHDQHGAEFDRNADSELPTREELMDSTLQLAPLTLIDGSWLQGFTDYGHAESEIGFPLFATYWDELGNGRAALNHPLLYRELLVEMGVELPPTASPQFAAWPGFGDSSFELPVYWLCIGRLPQTFQAETLGLNLAMELSGVGGSYRRTHVSLRKYGFSTRFVDIHNTIDNVATGHSAWAADAVDNYLAALAGSAGLSARDQAWQRVRTGYRSLTPPTGIRARRAGRRAQRAFADR